MYNMYVHMYMCMYMYINMLRELEPTPRTLTCTLPQDYNAHTCTMVRIQSNTDALE